MREPTREEMIEGIARGVAMAIRERYESRRVLAAGSGGTARSLEGDLSDAVRQGVENYLRDHPDALVAEPAR